MKIYHRSSLTEIMIFQTENLFRSPINSKFKYLGTYLSQNLSDDTDIDLRMNHDRYKKCQRRRPIDFLTSKDEARTQMPNVYGYQ
mmetsp:Transcript_22605/g.25750  ORF Transcript_22605/g.25750 Transcript_22605/m.25750 type:complete len:85 (-) Transcript_22605:286-540(-)